MRESKPACKSFFYSYYRPETTSQEFDGVLHLFEHQYDSATVFWYGVAEIRCSIEQFDAAMHISTPEANCIGVTLDDGREGIARMLNSCCVIDQESTYTRVSLTGWTNLEFPTFELPDSMTTLELPEPSS